MLSKAAATLSRAKTRHQVVLATLTVMIGASSPSFAQEDTFTFGLWGDMPYAKSGD